MPNEEIREKLIRILENFMDDFTSSHERCGKTDDKTLINLAIVQIYKLFPTAPKEEKALYPCCDTSNKKGEPCPIHNPQEKLKEEKPNYMVALKDEIKKLLGQGKSRQTISSQLGLPFSLIQSIIDRNKLEEKPKIEELKLDDYYRINRDLEIKSTS